MTEKTYITGKDASLEDAISNMKALLEKLGFEIEERSWLNPVPNVFSVHIGEINCPQLFSNGKGASRKAALASALGEFIERLATNYFFSDYWWKDEDKAQPWEHYPHEAWIPSSQDWRSELLDESLWSIYDANNEWQFEHLLDYNSSDNERGICALPMTDAMSGDSVLMPVNALANLYASNGMAAGNTKFEARVQGMSEIFERWVKNKIIAEGRALPDVPREVLEQYPVIIEALDKLESLGYPVWVKDASMGGLYPVINVTMQNPEDGKVFASFGAHPNFEVAVERTLTELFQGRSLDNLDGFQHPTSNMDVVESSDNLEMHFIDSSGLIHFDFFGGEPDYAFVHWDFSGTTEEEYETLLAILKDEGRRLLIADFEHVGLYACRMVVPGMSEVYPFEDMLWANRNDVLSIRSSVLRFSELERDELAELSEALDECAIGEHELVSHSLGWLLPADHFFSGMRWGEFRLWLALRSEDHEAMMDALEWCTSFGELGVQRLRRVKLIESLFADCNHMEDIERFFGAELHQEYLALAEGRWMHPDMSESNSHQALLAAQQKVAKAKEIQWSLN